MRRYEKAKKPLTAYETDITRYKCASDAILPPPLHPAPCTAPLFSLLPASRLC